jgi:serine/threonine protein kinase
MPLTKGTKLGTYEITAAIGAGGMGEVYQAHDTKLGRDVAIKVLPEAFAHDADRLSRFQREAKMLAAWALGELKDTRAVEPLVLAEAGRDSHRYRMGNEALLPLVNIGPAAVPILMEMFRDPNSVLIYRKNKNRFQREQSGGVLLL